MLSINTFNSKEEFLATRDQLQAWVQKEFGANGISQSAMDSKFARLLNYKDFNTAVGELDKHLNGTTSTTVDPVESTAPNAINEPVTDSSEKKVCILHNPNAEIKCTLTIDSSPEVIEFDAQEYFAYLVREKSIESVVLAILEIKGDKWMALDEIATHIEGGWVNCWDNGSPTYTIGYGTKSVFHAMRLEGGSQCGFNVTIEIDTLLEWLATNVFQVFSSVMMREINEGNAYTDWMFINLECAAGNEASFIHTKGELHSTPYNNTVSHTASAVIGSEKEPTLTVDGDTWRDLDTLDAGVDMYYLAVAKYGCDEDKISHAMSV